MYSDRQERYCCIDCGYFSNRKCNIVRHNLSKSHMERMLPRWMDPMCKYQCKLCNKKYKRQSSLWYHNKSCMLMIDSIVDHSFQPAPDVLYNEIKELKSMVIGLSNSQMSVTNNITNNITNIQIFLNEKCKNAMEMSEFIYGIQFCAENFTKSNLLIVNALEHTAQIFKKRFDEMTLYERPIHNFTGEDNNQLIAHYRHNNEWKCQSELSILDEIYRDYNGDEPKDSIIYYLGQFHKRRLDYFNDNYEKNNHLGTNLRYTTYPEQQMDLARKVLEMAKLDPTNLQRSLI